MNPTRNEQGGTRDRGRGSKRPSFEIWCKMFCIKDCSEQTNRSGRAWGLKERMWIPRGPLSKILIRGRIDGTFKVTFVLTVKPSDIDEQALYAETGSKIGRGFIRSLEMGDRIAIIARAKVGFCVPHRAAPSNSDDNLYPVSWLGKPH